MESEKMDNMHFKKEYDLLTAKAEKKERTRQEADELAKGRPMDKI